ncbi:MFS transporter [Propionibacteriaceae bacterium Y1700]|uniref:MFS transporter n=1 Tax=Microlunatus sp. Y1700 TaxID=3418487 RepID=UPI003DA76622
MKSQSGGSILHQPKAVWAVAFAAVIAFMGIGLVDPILPAISAQLKATPSQAMLLFTSYLVITGLAMFFTSWASSRWGAKRTLLAGLVLIVLFAGAAGAAGSVGQIIGFRAGWGLGNALFISTALATIVGAASGGVASAIVLYEAALGLGIATGPLLGGFLGGISWRGPFFGTAALMAIGLILIMVLLPKSDRPTEPVSLSATLTALRHPALMALAVTAIFYNFGFFSLLAYSPFPIEAAGAAVGIEIGAHELGLVFFGWGLALAVTSVFVAPPMIGRYGRIRVLLGTLVLLVGDLVLLALGVGSLVVLVVGVVIGGLLFGVMNTTLTEAVMEATDLPRSVASSTYSGVRFLGGAVAAAVAGPLAEQVGPATPYWIGGLAVLGACLVLVIRRSALSVIDTRAEETPLDEAIAITAGDS